MRDGRLVTGQNPASATRAAELVVEGLSECRFPSGEWRFVVRRGRFWIWAQWVRHIRGFDSRTARRAFPTSNRHAKRRVKEGFI